MLAQNSNSEQTALVSP